jgi:transketolase
MAVSMREQMGETIADLFERDKRLMLVLADISRAFFEGIFTKYPERAYNVGIMEQTMVSVAAGMALEGFIPILHSIAPFLVERPFEQIKDDFCYQRLQGNFISIGASYDYSTEGMTHHGMGDAQILRSLPGMQIVVPGTAREFDRLFRAGYANGAPTYYRLSSANNPIEQDVSFGKMNVVKRGEQATVIAIGSALSYALPAVEGMDVNVLYCTTVAPFDAETLRNIDRSGSIVLVEPYYEGVLVPDICAALEPKSLRMKTIGMPHKVLSHYGRPEQHDEAIGFTERGIRQRIENFISRDC